MKRFFFLFILVVFAAFPAHAKPADELKQVEQQLTEKQKQQAALDAAARDASKGLEDLRAKLVASAQALQDKENEQDAIEDKLETLTQEIAEKSKIAKQERAQLSLMTSALVEIASRPPETLFLQNGITTDHIHRSLLFQSILPRLREQAEATARDLATLYDLQNQLAEQKKLLAQAQENLQQQQHDLDQLIAARQGFLQRTESEKEDIARHLAALSDQARDLRQLMVEVSPPRRATQKITKGDVTGLKWPVSGAVRHSFGDKDTDGVTSEGLTLAAPSGAPIVAPYAGRVVFAGNFRGYGKIVILQHANGYHSFLSGFGRIDADMGQDVVAGEPLGVLPVKAGSKPELYFEWRRGDEPVDPLGGLEARHG